MNSRKLVINCTNRIKIEKYGEFADSIFSEVYEKAARYTKAIVDAKRENNKEIEAFCGQEVYHNIIPFLGDRGKGKSSAMVSYALFLKDYDRKGIFTDKFRLSEDDVEFYLLPRIDVEMLVKGENLLDIVLASMWKNFEKNRLADENESITKIFMDVKKSYEMFVDTITDNPKKSMASIREMKNLSRCLNLKEDFMKLVESFLKSVLKDCRKRFLVIALDDLDTATQDVYAVLEQIRIFLMIPNVIVLITADMGRLSLECNRYFMDKLIVKGEMLGQEKEQIRGYASKYLSKILPNNRRIYMPDVSMETAGKYQVVLNDKFKNLNESAVKFDIKHIVYGLIYKYTNIMFNPQKRIHAALRSISLRDIVNTLDSLQEIEEIEKLEELKKERQLEETIKWIAVRLEEYVGSIREVDSYGYMKQLLNTDSKYLNMVLAEYVVKNNDVRYGGIEEDNTYGNILSLLDNLEDKNGVKEFLVLLYSIKIAEDLSTASTNKIRNSLQYKNIFPDSAWRLENSWGLDTYDNEEDGFNDLHMEVQRTHTNILNIKVGDKLSSFGEWYTGNKDSIYTALCRAMLGDVNIWDESNTEHYKEYGLRAGTIPTSLGGNENSGGNTEYYMMLHKNDLVNVCIDNFFNNMIKFETCFKGIFLNISRAYNNNTSQEEFTNIIDSDALLKSYKKWKETYKVYSVKDILPLESVEVMYEISEKINRIQYFSEDEEAEIKLIERQVDIIMKQLETAEHYYSELGIEVNKYSEKIKEFLKLFGENGFFN